MSESMWAPGELEIMIHCYCSPERSRFYGSPFYGLTIDRLLDLGLIEYEDGIPHATERGKAFVGLLTQTPVPVAVYVDPRFSKEGGINLANPT